MLAGKQSVGDVTGDCHFWSYREDSISQTSTSLGKSHSIGSTSPYTTGDDYRVRRRYEAGHDHTVRLRYSIYKNNVYLVTTTVSLSAKHGPDIVHVDTEAYGIRVTSGSIAEQDLFFNLWGNRSRRYGESDHVRHHSSTARLRLLVSVLTEGIKTNPPWPANPTTPPIPTAVVERKDRAETDAEISAEVIKVVSALLSPS